MDVLMLETEPGAADSAIEELGDRGHHVFRGHEPGSPAFPCRALEGRGPCPLADPGIDVAVTVRDHPGTRPSLFEDGVACALRARVPLVVAGRATLNPYEDWAEESSRTAMSSAPASASRPGHPGLIRASRSGRCGMCSLAAPGPLGVPR
jgi:hypothetical protein